MGQPNILDKMPLQPQLVVETFDIWAYQPSLEAKNLHFSLHRLHEKWVEVVALVKANDQVVIDFLYKDITHFGVPKEIITDGGLQFVSHKFEAFLQNYHIQHRITSPYHP